MEHTLLEILEQRDSGVAGEQLRKWLRHQTRAALLEIVEEEVRLLCGPKHTRDKEGACYRAGSAPSSVYVDGRREKLKRPRVRRATGHGSEEQALKSWRAAQDPEEWEKAMMRAILCGVSCRGMGKLRESEVLGESKSSISRMWQRKAACLVEEMQQADLSEVDLLVLMLDAVVLCKDLVATVALAVDTTGRKHILGFRVGSSENREVCRDLLSNLKRRGLKVAEERRLLAVLDGSQALEKALLEAYPTTLIQRCLVHKERNIRGYLSKRHWKELAVLFRRLRHSQGEEAALEAARALEAFLADKNAQAHASLAETGEGLLTIFRLGVPNSLHVSLLSTNAIENAFKNLRRHIGRVARWREETDQADIWLASGLTLAQQTFRRIKGYAEIPALIEALGTSRKAAVATGGTP